MKVRVDGDRDAVAGPLDVHLVGKNKGRLAVADYDEFDVVIFRAGRGDAAAGVIELHRIRRLPRAGHEVHVAGNFSERDAIDLQRRGFRSAGRQQQRDAQNYTRMIFEGPQRYSKQVVLNH